jgi:hypothetical protein
MKNTLIIFCALLCACDKIKARAKAVEPTIIERIIEVPAKPKKLAEVLIEKSEAFGIPVELTLAIAQVESSADERNEAMNFAPNALGAAKNHRRLATAYGVMQIVPAYHLGKTGGCSDLAESWSDLLGRKNLEANVECGLRHLKNCYTRAKNAGMKGASAVEGALACYNSGGLSAEATEKNGRGQSYVQRTFEQFAKNLINNRAVNLFEK